MKLALLGHDQQQRRVGAGVFSIVGFVACLAVLVTCCLCGAHTVPSQAWAAVSDASAEPLVTLSTGDDFYDDNSFVVAVVDQNNAYVIAPTLVSYADSDTVQDALENAHLGFEIDNGFVSSVAGSAPKDGSYMFTFTNYDERDNVALDEIEAASIKALFITSADVGIIANGHVQLLEALRTYLLESQDGIGLCKYPDAVQAANRAVQGLPTASNEQAASIGSDFDAAIAAYHSIMKGKRYKVTFKVDRNGKAVTRNESRATLTDIYGNQTTAQYTTAGTFEAEVVALEYSYEVMDSTGMNGVRGSDLVVKGATTLSAQIPTETWFNIISLRLKSNANNPCSTNGASLTFARNITYYVPDIAKPEADVYVYAAPADAITQAAGAQNVNKDYPLYAVYTGTDGEYRERQIAYRSFSYAPEYLVDQGSQATEAAFEIRHPVTTSSAGNMYQVEKAIATLQREPTLKALSVTQGTAELLSNFNPFTRTYDVYASADNVTLSAEAFGSTEEGYEVRVGNADSSQDVVVDVPDYALDAAMPVTVDAAVKLGASTTTYKVKIHKLPAVSVSLRHDAGVLMKVTNEAGSAIDPLSDTGTVATFLLSARQPYSYSATKDTYYHTNGSFVAQDSLQMDIPTPVTVDAVSFLGLGRDNLWNDASATNPPFAVDTAHSTNHEWYFLVPDKWSTRPYLRADISIPSQVQLYSYGVSYARQDTNATITQTFSATSANSLLGRVSGPLDNFVTASGYSNTACLTVTTGTDPATGAVYSQDYYVVAKRIPSLATLAASNGQGQRKLEQVEASTPTASVYGFETDVYDYSVAVPEGTQTLRLSYAFQRPVRDDALAAGGYSVLLDDKETNYEAGRVFSQDITLDTQRHKQTVTIVVKHEDPNTADTTYRIAVRQMPKVSVSFNTVPADTTVTVTDQSTGNRVFANDDGTFDLISGYTYAYTASARGYVGKSGEFLAYDGLNMSLVLSSAPQNPTIDTGLTAHWPYFRADADNNGVINARTPLPATEAAALGSSAGSGQGGQTSSTGQTSQSNQGEEDDESQQSSDALLYWASKLGDGYDSGAAGCPILVDGYLYTYAGDQIFKLDTVTGETVAKGTMVGTSSFAITPMTYAEGMVFVALSNGRVEAFNATTLESCWVYTSPNGGQPNCPITYYNGCIYTGFWNWSNVCDFVCLTVTDEDPATPGSAIEDNPARPGQTMSVVKDAKVPLWTYSHAGGFYWAGAWAGTTEGGREIVLVGSDDAGISAGLSVTDESKASGTVFSLDAATGQCIDTITEYPAGVNVGNIRTTIMRDASTGRFYWCGRGGYLCSADVDAQGQFNKASVSAIRLSNNASDGMVSSTSTPVVYNGRAYVGADHGAYNAYNGQSVDVVDLASGTVAYTVNMQGRAQASALVTTAYVEEDGYVYVYFFDNYTPGKLRCFKDKPGQTRALDCTTEKWDAGTDAGTYSNVAPVVFTPQAAQAQYCICSPIADEYGTIYFKNDSAYMMAVGAPIEKLEIVKNPSVTTYAVGETFDASGMKVEAVYANGVRRDVTDYVEYTSEPFTESQRGKTVKVPIRFPYALYQSGASSQDIGTPPDYNYEKPIAFVPVTVGGSSAPRITTDHVPQAKATDYSPVPGQEETPYNVQFSAVGVPRVYSWPLVGTLPQGLSFDAQTGVISGVPAVGSGGAYPLTVTVNNGAGTDTKSFTLEVYERPQLKTESTQLVAQAGEDFSHTFQATGYPLPLTYELHEGYKHPVQGWESKTPAGLTLDEHTGELSGKPLETGTFHVRVLAGNAAGVSNAKHYTLTVSGEAQPLTGQLSINTDTLGTPLPEEGDDIFFVTRGQKVTLPLEVSGATEGTDDIVVDVKGLPAGLEYDARQGVITGTPLQVRDSSAGTEAIVTVTAKNGYDRDAVRTYVLYVFEPPTIALDTDAWTAAEVGQAYSQPLAVVGTPTPRVIVTGQESRLHYSAPDGDATQGVVAGTARMTGEFSVTVVAENAAGSTTRTYTHVVGSAAQINAPAVLPQAVLEASYSSSLGISGYPEPEVTVEGLPGGLAYNAQTQSIQGAPEQTGTFEVSVTAQNNVGTSASKKLTLHVGKRVQLLTTELAPAGVGVSYQQVLEFDEVPKQVTVEDLPDGLVFDADSLTITGTPQQNADKEEVYLVDIDAASESDVITRAVLKLRVLPSMQAPYKAACEAMLSLWPAIAGKPYSVYLGIRLQMQGIPSVFSWSLAEGSTLPQGLQLNSSGLLSGTPVNASGLYEFSVLCSNGVGTPARLDLTLFVSKAPALVAANPPAGKVGQAYTFQLTSDGVPNPLYSWTAAERSTLPAGLELDSGTGLIFGTPTTAGTYTVLISAENDAGETSQKFVFVIQKPASEKPPVVTVSPLKNPSVAKATKAKTAKYAKVKKKAQIVKGAIKVTKAPKGAKIRYKRVKKGSSKWLSKVNAKTGAITVKKGAKKGTWKVKVKVTVTAAGYTTYTKTITAKVKVK